MLTNLSMVHLSIEEQHGIPYLALIWRVMMAPEVELYMPLDTKYWMGLN